MKITVDKDRVFSLLDTLLERWNVEPKKYPYNNDDAILPQVVIPEVIRQDKRKLACFYFYICIYMRGGIKSLQAFQAMARMYQDHPDFFDPLHAQWLDKGYVHEILSTYIGWDAKAAAITWIENSRRLVQYWEGDPLTLLVDLHDYDEACRRISNKRTKKARKTAGDGGIGFRGFQYKMVSMFLYFCDWEGWLKEDFLYPAPADFHNFRLAFAHQCIVLDPQPRLIRVTEKHSKVWRQVLMQYMKERTVRPVEVADALWLFSLVMCGNSPVTQYIVSRTEGVGLFDSGALPHDDASAIFAAKNRDALQRTCLSCPISSTCKFAIPAGPYYQRGEGLGGKLFFWERYPVEAGIKRLSPAPPQQLVSEESQLELGL